MDQGLTWQASGVPTAAAPILLADGVSVSFWRPPFITVNGVIYYPAAAPDFALWDTFTFILCSTMAVSYAYNQQCSIDAHGLLDPVTGVYVAHPAAAIRALLTAFRRWQAGDFDNPALTAFDAAFPYEVGWVITSPTEFGKIIDALLSGLPALYFFKMSGALSLALLSPPAGTPVLTLTDLEMLQAPEGQEDAANLYRRAYLNYQRNWNVQQTVSPITVGPMPVYYPDGPRLAWLGMEWRVAAAKNDPVVTNYPLAADLGPVDTALTQMADARAVAAALLTICQERRELIRATTKIQPFQTELGSLVSIKRTRFKQTVPQLFLLVGLELDFTNSQAILTLWR